MRLARVALCALMSGSMSGCLSLPSIHLPTSAAPAPAPAPSKPVCPGNLSADIQAFPQLPSGAGFPAATDAASSAAVSLYLTWLHSLAVYARQGWERAVAAKTFCDTPR